MMSILIRAIFTIYVKRLTDFHLLYREVLGGLFERDGDLVAVDGCDLVVGVVGGGDVGGEGFSLD